jgi:hypothetical protein
VAPNLNVPQPLGSVVKGRKLVRREASNTRKPTQVVIGHINVGARRRKSQSNTHRHKNELFLNSPNRETRSDGDTIDVPEQERWRTRLTRPHGGPHGAALQVGCYGV